MYAYVKCESVANRADSVFNIWYMYFTALFHIFNILYIYNVIHVHTYKLIFLLFLNLILNINLFNS